MGFWAFRDKVAPGPPSASDPALDEQVPGNVPARFEAVAEALAAGRTATDACEVVGRLQGSQGVSLEETLADLRTTYELVLSAEPAFTDACAVALGWSEATLAYLHQLSCADPLTGLASMAHLRGRLDRAVPRRCPRFDSAARPLRAGRGGGVRAAPVRHRRRGLRRRPADVADRRVRTLRLRRPTRPSAGSARAASSSSPPATRTFPVVCRSCAACSRSVSEPTAASASGARACRWCPTRPRACSTSSPATKRAAEPEERGLSVGERRLSKRRD